MSMITSNIIGSVIAMKLWVEIWEQIPAILDIILAEEYYLLYGEQVTNGMEWLFK